ncbi:uncharacterized protein [Amphiura filiformis]|uniref:uncharacterized protein n=1 Tax=Amphiura filiformis TaxID=82378 RepID=UPI003B2101F5
MASTGDGNTGHAYETTISQPQPPYAPNSQALTYPPAASAPPQNQSAPGDPYPPQAPPSNTYPPQNTAPYPPQGTPPNTTPYPPQNQTPYPSQNTTPYPTQGPPPPNTAPYPPQGSAYPPQENTQPDAPPRYSEVFGADPAKPNVNYGYQHDQQTPNYTPAQPYTAYPPQQPAPQVIIHNNQVQQQQAAAPANITIVRSVQTGSPPNNYLCLSIFSFFCCFIFGIVAIIHAAMVNSYWREGRHNEARQAASKARGFAIAAVVFGIVIIVLNVVFRVVAAQNQSDYY